MSDFAYPWCSECQENFPMHQSSYDDLEECGNTFYCPSGHALEISRSSIVSRLRSADRLASSRWETIERMEKSAVACRGLKTRQRNRLLRGDCPYCGKTFNDIIDHIQKQHHSKPV